MARINSPQRIGPHIREIINRIRARYVMAGKTPPPTSKITDSIINKAKKQNPRFIEELENEFIRF